MERPAYVVFENQGSGSPLLLARFRMIQPAMEYVERNARPDRVLTLCREGVKPPRLNLRGHMRKPPGHMSEEIRRKFAASRRAER